VIDNDVHVFGKKYPLWLRVIININLKDQILLLLQLGDGRYFKIDIFAPEFAPQVSTHTCANFYPFLSEVESFTKNGDKFGWVKYW